MNYDIFLDESGLFLESSTNVQEREAHAHDDGRKFPSQIAGILCREGVITSGNANSMLKAACNAGGIPYEARFHANEHCNDVGFSSFVDSFCESLGAKGVQPVRLVNAEEVSFGDRVATYCNILAELLVRVCQQLEAQGESPVSLNVYAARVVATDDAKTGIEFIDRSDYFSRIQELFGRAAVANGFNSSRFRWNVASFQIRSAREDRRLQLADVVSYTSHDDFWPLKRHSAANTAMRSALAAFDWTFSCDETLARVLDLVNRESHAVALIALAERATTDGVEKATVDRYETKAREVVSALEGLPPATRNPQFQMIASWLNQVAEQRHDLDSSLRCCQWMQKILCERQSSESWPADWLRLITDTWALTACNHDANTIEGCVFADQIEAIVPKLSSRWEYAEDLMFSFIVRAVHQNDCFKHRDAADRMAAVVGYYESLDGFFADAFKGVFPEKVLSDLRARALGTQLQSEIALLLTSQGDLARCREISDQAISEFQHDRDRSRQWQYRCELEAVIGDWDSARKYLGQSLDLTDATHDAIADCLGAMPDHFGKAFALLHWSRIGAMSVAAQDFSESAAFLSAFRRAKLQHTPWCQGEPCVGDMPVYPTHGILRNIAIANAGSGDAKATADSIGCLRRVVEVKPRPVFQMIQIAAHFQCAALLAKSRSQAANKLLFGDKKSVGATVMMDQLAKHVAGVQPMVEKILAGWREEIAAQSESEISPRRLLEMGRMVGY